MVNERIINYFREYKDRFPKEVLKEKLITAGYPEKEVKEGIEVVYGRRKDFRELETAKLYTTSGQKLLDFLIGFFAPEIVSIVVYFLLYLFSFYFKVYFHSLFIFFILLILILVGQIFGIFYFWKKRKYLALGLLFALLFPFIVLGVLFPLVCFEILF